MGRLLAEKLGVPFYDKAVIKTLQEKYHISPEEIERLKGRKHSWWADVERILKIDSGMSMDYYMPKKGDAPDLPRRRGVVRGGRPQRLPRVPPASQPPERPHPGLDGESRGAHHAQAEHDRR